MQKRIFVSALLVFTVLSATAAPVMGFNEGSSSDRLTLEWSKNIGPDYASATVDNDTVYAFSNRYGYAFDLSTGQTEWRVNLTAFNSTLDTNGPIVTNDTVYFIETPLLSTDVHAVDRENGSIRWSRDIEELLDYTVRDGQLYLLTQGFEERVETFDPATGERKVSNEVPGISKLSEMTVINSTVYVDVDDDLYRVQINGSVEQVTSPRDKWSLHLTRSNIFEVESFGLNGSASIRKVNPKTGNRSYRTDLPINAYDDLAIHDETLYFKNAGTFRVTAFDGPSGDVIFNRSIPRIFEGLFIGHQSDYLILWDSELQYSIQILDRESGEYLFNSTIPTEFNQYINMYTIHNDSLIVGYEDGELHHYSFTAQKSSGTFSGAVARYNTDGDQVIDIQEIGAAAADYAAGKITINELSTVAQAYVST